MYYDFMNFVLDKLNKLNLKFETYGITKIVENVTDFTIRPSITYGSNTDFTNKRREEDWILTLQCFLPHNSSDDILQLSSNIRKEIIKNCSSTTINDVIFTVDEVSLANSYDSDFNSINILIYVNSKEII